MGERQIDDYEDERDDLPLETAEQVEAAAAEGGSDDAELEARARAQGWVPEDEWDDERAEREGRRKPRQFVSAREYLEKADNSMPLLRDQVRKLTDQVVEQKQLLVNMNGFIQEQRKSRDKAIADAYERGIAKARDDMRKAVEEGDIEQYDKAEKQLHNLQQQREEQRRGAEESEQAPPSRQQQPQIDPAINAWIAENPWFQRDPILQRAAKDEDDVLLQEMPDMPTYDRLEEVRARVQRRYPERFPGSRRQDGGPRRPGAASVATPSGGRAGARAGGSVEAQFSALPADARQTFVKYRDMFKAQGIEYTKEEYLREYNATA